MNKLFHMFIAMLLVTLPGLTTHAVASPDNYHVSVCTFVDIEKNNVFYTLKRADLVPVTVQVST